MKAYFGAGEAGAVLERLVEKIVDRKLAGAR